jgi:hypothetical protein
MRRSLLTLSAVFALTLAGAPAEAQFSYGVQGAVITSVDNLGDFVTGAANLSGTWGLGARAAFNAPALPIGLVGQGNYYFTDVDDHSYMTYSLAAQFRLSTPVISPYALAGWQWRRSSTGGASTTDNGAMIGVGLQLHLGVTIFLEGNYEFNEEFPSLPDFDNNPVVIKGGIMIG